MAIANATLTNTASSIFTSAGPSGDAVALVSFTNYDTSAHTVSLHACPSAEAAADENLLIKDLSIPAGNSFTYEAKVLLSNGDDLKAIADANASVSVTVSYV
jgi:hypothetical protein